MWSNQENRVRKQVKNPCEARKIRASQNLHKIISTRLLTVLTIRVILRTEQRKRKKKSSSSFDENDNSTQECSQYKEESVMLMPSIFGENLFDDWMRFPTERQSNAGYTHC